MTDAGQGLALKGADEVGGAQEDNTSDLETEHETEWTSEWTKAVARTHKAQRPDRAESHRHSLWLRKSDASAGLCGLF